MRKKAVLVMVLAASVAFALAESARVGARLPGTFAPVSSLERLVGGVSKPVYSVGLGDFFAEIIRLFGQLVER